ncbi:glycosyltransferase [Phenylobacterium sp.]|uniref:glycosyltransferase n=1 Tax=Phenylobacterium sp. TaxID=1871053 RepID=UPI0028117DB9|nr:glycosyltransferase [Phenylobacterium sp.]
MVEPYPILLSVVVPLQNVAGRVRTLVEPLVRELSGQVEDFEIVVVDNGSTDGSAREYAELVGEGGLPNLQIYRLIQAVDQEVAVWAGVENALGDYVLVLDPLNEDLSFLPRALEKIAAGCDLITIRNTTPKPMAGPERLLDRLFRATYRRLVGVDLAVEGASCRLISKRVVSFLLQQPKPALRYRALPALAGFPKASLDYAGPRAAVDRDGLRAKARRGLNLLFAQTILPLRIASALAIAGATLNLIYSGYVILIRLFKADVMPGWTTLSLQQSGMFFLLSLVIFILVEYVAQMLVWTLEGPSYYLAGEHTSAVLTRRSRLNVQAVRKPAAKRAR